MDLSEEIARMWQNENYLPLMQVKADFTRDEPLNPKVKEFKKLLERYKDKQAEFEKSSELFSPYCIGYGNITSPVWFLGEAEGGNDSSESDVYNRQVKTRDVLSKQHILDNVFITPCELIRKFRIGKGRNGQGCDYVNFIFASKIILTLLGQDIAKMNDTEIAEEAGNYQFFTEFWRHRAPPDILEKRVMNGNRKWDVEHEKFLLDLDDTLNPKVIIAYPPANKTFDDGQNTQEKVRNLFRNTNRLIELTGGWNVDTLIDRLKDSINNRPVLLTRWPGQLTNEQIINIGIALKTIWTKDELFYKETRKEQKMLYFMGVAVKNLILDASLENGIFYDVWLRSGDRYYNEINNYQGVNIGSIGFLYRSPVGGEIYGVFEATGAPRYVESANRIESWASLEIPVKRIKVYPPIRNAKDFLRDELHFAFHGPQRYPWPLPRVFGEDKGQRILARLQQ